MLVETFYENDDENNRIDFKWEPITSTIFQIKIKNVYLFLEQNWLLNWMPSHQKSDDTLLSIEKNWYFKETVSEKSTRYNTV